MTMEDFDKKFPYTQEPLGVDYLQVPGHHQYPIPMCHHEFNPDYQFTGDMETPGPKKDIVLYSCSYHHFII